MALRKRTDLIVVHVTATPPNRDIGAKEIDAMHRARGWRGIGYHYVIRRDGRVEKGRPENQVGAHVAGWNSVSLGVALVGGVDAAGRAQDNRTPAQKEALEKLLRRLVTKHAGASVCGHRDLSPDRDGDGIIEPHEWLKECPCFDAIPWAQSVGLPAADIRGPWSAAGREGPDARVRWLQRLLNNAGYDPGPANGIAGPTTRAAIRSFQAAKGIEPSGEFDAQTVTLLRQTAEGEAPLQSPPRQPDDPGVEPDPGAEADDPEEEPIAKSKRFWTWLSTGGGTALLPFVDWKVQFLIVVLVAGFAIYAIATMPAVRRKLGLG